MKQRWRRSPERGHGGDGCPLVDDWVEHLARLEVVSAVVTPNRIQFTYKHTGVIQLV